MRGTKPGSLRWPARCGAIALLAAGMAALAEAPVEQAKLVAGDAQTAGEFGYPATIDGSTAAIGSGAADHSGATDAGAVYVFTRSGSAWSQQAKLVASDAASDDWFGSAIGLAGDTALVGAFLDDNAAGEDAGSVYVYERSGSAWTERSRFVASDTAAGDWFGGWISIDGDTAVVGASNDDLPTGDDAGSAWVFVRNAGTWTEQAKLVDADGGAADFFGGYAAISGDTVVIGSYQDDTPAGADAGSVCVFVRNGSTWTRQAKLFAPDGAAGDWFGVSVAISGDTIAVAAPVHSHGGPARSGAVYVFRRSGSTWNLEAEIRAPQPAADAVYGHPAISGDTLLVSATGETVSGVAFAGASHLYTRSGGVWTHQARLTASDPGADDRFGVPSISGSTALVAAGSDDHAGGTDAGSVYVFTGLPGATGPAIPATPTDLRARRGPRAGLALTWTDASDDETAFRVERRRGVGGWEPLASPPADTTSLADATTEPGIRFTYRIRAENVAGESEWSADASAVPDPAGGGLDVAVARGSTVRDVPGAGVDLVIVQGKFGRNHLAAGTFVADTDPVRIDVGDGGDDAIHRFASVQGAGLWKVDARRNRATYTRKTGSKVTEQLVLDLKKGTFSLRVKDATLPRLPVSPVRVLVALGADSGAQVADWTQPKPDRVVYTAGLASLPLDPAWGPHEAAISYRGDIDRYDFTLEAEADVTLRFTAGTLASGKFTLTGPGASRKPVGSGKFTATSGPVTWQQRLLPGTYSVAVTTASVARYGTYTIELVP